MGKDEKKGETFIGTALSWLQARALSRAIEDQFRVMSVLTPTHHRPAGKVGGSLAHQQWKRRRAAGWDR